MTYYARLDHFMRYVCQSRSPTKNAQSDPKPDTFIMFSTVLIEISILRKRQKSQSPRLSKLNLTQSAFLVLIKREAEFRGKVRKYRVVR